jgi:hypothetical protein
MNKRHMNIKDVYDDSELKQYSPNLTFLKAVDQRTGYRSKQMLIAPILGGDSGNDLMGVIQMINNLAGQPVLVAARRGGRSSCPRRSRSPSACASRCRARCRRSSSTW